ncbi:MAG: RNA polymerase sigma factor, partial [Candidatus Binatia bacterium]
MATATGTDEKALVKAAQGGDRDAFLDLYEAYATPIFDFCHRMVRNRADAEDVTSEVFLKAMERLGSLRDPAAFKGWLYQIARNAALSHIEARRKVTPVPEHHESAQSEATQTLPSPEGRSE